VTSAEFELAHEVADWLGLAAMAIIGAAVLIAIVSVVLLATRRDFNGAFEVF
jgi:hypothetical protein